MRRFDNDYDIIKTEEFLRRNEHSKNAFSTVCRNDIFGGKFVSWMFSTPRLS